ncbi:hypothetical protein SePPVgORF017 [Seal parapoxvirus]|uniref:Uncharacterized protein n=1 Tax=Seal parapoxvirus TaxID=187984 RepID=A0A1Z3GCX7_9POXV|nr:hypothetical protein CGV03_gp017 [Seal parapoxvirus]ASC55611.1 hypothetical protein SePPVgORF017 [Seal parapoxvirus]
MASHSACSEHSSVCGSFCDSFCNDSVFTDASLCNAHCAFQHHRELSGSQRATRTTSRQSEQHAERHSGQPAPPRETEPQSPVMIPTLSLEQLLNNSSVTQSLVPGCTETDARHLLEELSSLCVGDQITMLRCLAGSFYWHAAFVPYACLHIVSKRMRTMYAREVVHLADDLVDALSADTNAFRRYRERVLEEMASEEMNVYRYLTSTNADIDEDNLLSAVETLLRQYRHMGCYRSLCMLKILALQHEDLTQFILGRIKTTRESAHWRTRTVFV